MKSKRKRNGNKWKRCSLAFSWRDQCILILGWLRKRLLFFSIPYTACLPFLPFPPPCCRAISAGCLAGLDAAGLRAGTCVTTARPAARRRLGSIASPAPHPQHSKADPAFIVFLARFPSEARLTRCCSCVRLPALLLFLYLFISYLC